MLTIQSRRTMSQVVFPSHWILFETDRLVANPSTRTRLSSGRLSVSLIVPRSHGTGPTPASSRAVMQLKGLQIKNCYWRTYTMLLKVEYVTLVNEFDKRLSRIDSQFPYFRTAPSGWKVS